MNTLLFRPRPHRSSRLATMMLVALLLNLVSLSCHTATSPPRPKKSAQAKEYELTGKVISIDKPQRQVVIAHEEVAGFMDAMTMPFTLIDEWAFDNIAIGDSIRAVLVVDGDRSWLEQSVITRESLATDSSAPNALTSEPQPGDSVASFTLVNQTGKNINTNDYQGRALLLTFIYTRCPLPEYCPLMTANFARVSQLLQAEPALSAKTHLLSITVDPTYDTPQVLKRYAAAHAETSGKSSSTAWEFATGTPEQIQGIAGFFGLNYFAEKDQIVHSLRTALIAPDGKVYKIYRGNDWKPEQVVSDLREMLK